MPITAAACHVCRVAALEKRTTQVHKEKELIEKKMQRIEKAKEQEVAELRQRLDASQGEVRAQLKAKDDKLNEVSGAVQRQQCNVSSAIQPGSGRAACGKQCRASSTGT